MDLRECAPFDVDDFRRVDCAPLPLVWRRESEELDPDADVREDEEEEVVALRGETVVVVVLVAAAVLFVGVLANETSWLGGVGGIVMCATCTAMAWSGGREVVWVAMRVVVRSIGV